MFVLEHPVNDLSVPIAGQTSHQTDGPVSYRAASVSSPSIISDVEKQVRARIDELRPLVEEYEQLQEVLRTSNWLKRRI